ncbi:hypothetical protein IL306_008822 [Fusarium sp. DS 682]|nr:hypothetical protein IL306_008822 [Fusarium sp. DS 682]
MARQAKRKRPSERVCNGCRCRNVTCEVDGLDTECLQCKPFYLNCEWQNAGPSSEHKDEMVQGSTQVVDQVEPCMVSMRSAIDDTLATKLEAETNRNANHKSVTVSEDDHPQSSGQQYMQIPQSLLIRQFKDLLPDRRTLVNILKYTGESSQLWSRWPLATTETIQRESPNPYGVSVKTFDAGFPVGSVESALSFYDKSMQSKDLGAVSKCVAWLFLSFKELPSDFKSGSRPVRGDWMIYRCIAKVDALYQTCSTLVCNIDFVQALILQHELFVSIGRPRRAWKYIRIGIEKAMLLGLHNSRSSLERGIWEELWMRDRQLSLFLGLPYAVPEHFTFPQKGIERSSDEKEAYGELARISGLITDRNRLREHVPPSTIKQIHDEMEQFRQKVSQRWSTNGDREYAVCFPQVLSYNNIMLFHYALELMIHLPYSQTTNQDEGFEPPTWTKVKAAKALIQVHECIRVLESDPNVPTRADFLDFLAFKAALVLAENLASKKTLRLADEERRLWGLIQNLAHRLRDTHSVFRSQLAKQAATALEILYGASQGVFRSPGTYQVTIPYFGRLKMSKVKVETQHYIPKCMGPRLEKIIVEMESNLFAFVPQRSHVTELELEANWTAEEDSTLEYGWKRVYEIVCT